MARPKLEIDEKLVEQFASLGCKNTEIAEYFNCHHETIGERFSDVLSKGRAELKMSLRQWQLKSAKNGNVAMQIWLGKQMLGQRDQLDVGAGEGQKIIEVKLSYDPTGE